MKTSSETRERILKVVREKKQIYKGKPIKITADFSTETLKVKRAGSTKLQEKKKQERENLNLGTHNQIFKQLTD
jgi:hypothetical protein